MGRRPERANHSRCAHAVTLSFESAAEASKNFVNLEQLSREEQESRLLELAESGDMIGAVTMARRLYSYDLTAAKQFVEGLVRKPATRRIDRCSR